MSKNSSWCCELLGSELPRPVFTMGWGHLDKSNQDEDEIDENMDGE